MAIPPNTTFATAIVITSLPFSVTTSAFDSGTTYDLWYKYTAVIGEDGIGVYGYNDIGTYKPIGRIYPTNDLGEPDLVSDFVVQGEENVSVQVAIITGETYFIRFWPGFGTHTSANIIINIISHSNLAYSVGSIVIPDDTWGFPATVLSPVNGEVLQFIQGFPAGEEGDSLLADGTILVEDYNTNSVKLYNSDFELLNTYTYTTLELPDAIVRGIFAVQTGTKNFYVLLNDSGSDSDTIRKISSNGTLDSTIWILPGAGLKGDIAVNTSETIAYIVSGNTGSEIIMKWDLVNNIELTSWTPIATGDIRHICILDNDNIIIMFTEIISADVATTTINEYNNSQTLLHSYTFTEFESGARMKPIAGDTTAIWIWFLVPPTGEISTFIKLRLSDGAHLVEFTRPQYNVGSYSGDPLLPPTDRFGHSNSCPFFLTYTTDEGGGGGEPEPEPLAPGGIYFINPTKATRHDSYYESVEKKIPNPTIKTALIGE